MNFTLVILLSLLLLSYVFCGIAFYKYFYWSSYASYISECSTDEEAFTNRFKIHVPSKFEYMGVDFIVIVILLFLLPILNIAIAFSCVSDIFIAKKQINKDLNHLFNQLHGCTNCNFFIRKGHILRHSIARHELECPICKEKFKSAYSLHFAEYSKISPMLSTKDCMNLIKSYQVTSHSFRANEEYQRFLDSQVESKVTTTIRNTNTLNLRKDDY